MEEERTQYILILRAIPEALNSEQVPSTKINIFQMRFGVVGNAMRDYTT